MKMSDNTLPFGARYKKCGNCKDLMGDLQIRRYAIKVLGDRLRQIDDTISGSGIGDRMVLIGLHEPDIRLDRFVAESIDMAEEIIGDKE